MNELARVAASLQRKGLTVLAGEVQQIALDLTDDPISNVLSAYKSIHQIGALKSFAGDQTICSRWRGDNGDWCAQYALFVWRGEPVCSEHFKELSEGRMPTEHDRLAHLRTIAVVRKNNLPKEERCPFGLPIPQACQTVGESIQAMEANAHSFKHNRTIFSRERQGLLCPYAARVFPTKRAVDCNFGTSTEGLTTPKLYHSSPIYPKLWEGFNTVNLDRNYHQYRDFNYVSVYG